MHPWLVPSSGPPRPRCGSSCDSRSRPAALARRSREPARAAAPRRPTPAATSCRVSDTAASCRVSDTAASCRVSVPPAADSRCPSIPPHTHTPKAAGQGPCLSVTLLSIPRFDHAAPRRRAAARLLSERVLCGGGRDVLVLDGGARELLRGGRRGLRVLHVPKRRCESVPKAFDWCVCLWTPQPIDAASAYRQPMEAPGEGLSCCDAFGVHSPREVGDVCLPVFQRRTMKRYGHEKQTSCERAETAGSAGSARLPVCSAWAASQGAARHGRPGRLPQGRSRACSGLGAVAVGSKRRLAAPAWRSWGCAMRKKQSRTRACRLAANAEAPTWRK